MSQIKKYTAQNKQTNLSYQDLYGTWKLQDFVIEKENENLIPWGNNTTGLLIYSADGYMSVGFNKEMTSSGHFEDDVFQSILFYSGTYQLTKPTEIELIELLNNPFTNCMMILKHCVLQASDPQRVGQTQNRYIAYEIAEDKSIYLTLSSAQESFGRGIVKWKKEKINI